MVSGETGELLSTGFRLLTSSLLCVADIQKATVTPRSSSHVKAFEDPAGGKGASVCLLWLIPSGSFTQILPCENSNVRQNIRESPCPNLDPFFILEYSTESHLGLFSLSEILTNFTLSTAQILGYFYFDGREERNLTMYEYNNLCL